MGSEASNQQHVIDLTEAIDTTPTAAYANRVGQVAANRSRNRNAAAAPSLTCQRHRWLFTVNNLYPSDIYRATVGELVGDDGPLTYLCIADEEAPTTGTKHVQGYLYVNKDLYPKGLRMGQVVDLMNTYSRPHTHSVYPVGDDLKDNAQCIAYVKGLVSKKGMVLNSTFQDWGDAFSVPGVKEAKADSTCEETILLAREGRFDQIAPSHQLKYYASIKSIYADAHLGRLVSDLPKPNTWWVWGLAGSGKTTYAYNKIRELYGKEPYPKDPSEKWWAAYPFGGNEVQLPVVFDDVGPFHVKNAGLWKVEWGDRAFISQMKHGSGYIRPPFTIVTSQYHPSSVFRDRETLEAMMRRCKVFELVRIYDGSGQYKHEVKYEEHTGTGDQDWARANPCTNSGMTGTVATFNLPEAMSMPENPALAFSANAHLLRQAQYSSTILGQAKIDTTTPRMARQGNMPEPPTKNPRVTIERSVLNLETGEETPLNDYVAPQTPATIHLDHTPTQPLEDEEIVVV